MSIFIEYLAKLSISFAVVWLFYQFVLRRLTFYDHNRWYLLVYSLLSFVIPLINISPALHQNDLTDSSVVQWVPLVYNSSTTNTSLSFWSIVSIFVVAGMLFMLVRLLMQLISFRRMMRTATLVSGEDIRLYQVNESIIPFSFGNAVFFNVNLHTTEELEKIIRHEFVHVKQRHSIDIIFSEILCLLNWYNPFAWMIRAAIRQNLEFVADNIVLENGISKKQYQYLLLKVIGNDQFSIAQKFNFSSLKKRIVMMNKNKSTKKHLLRFLFLLPVLAFILVSFRKEIGNSLTGKSENLKLSPDVIYDTIPDVSERNSKGYVINVKNNNGDCLLVIKDKGGKEVKRILLTDWNADASTFEAMYGEIPPPPPPLLPTIEQWIMAGNKNIKKVDFGKDKVTIFLKDGKEEKYNLNNPVEKEKFEKQYGHLDIAPPPPPPAAPRDVNAPTSPTPPAPVQLPDNVQNISINNDRVTVTLKGGEKENYDFSKPEQEKKFQKKYGQFVPPPPPPPAKTKISELPVSVAIREVPMLVSVFEERKIQSAVGSGTIIEEPVKRTSLLTNGNPIYIVDGVITNKARVDNINMETIVSVDVLKGNSAVALYGDKASEGVIAIKTKKAEASDKVYITVNDAHQSAIEKNKVALKVAEIEMNNNKELIFLDGKELPAERRKLSGTFNIVTLNKEEATKKYGDKGKNGAMEITTIN